MPLGWQGLRASTAAAQTAAAATETAATAGVQGRKEPEGLRGREMPLGWEELRAAAAAVCVQGERELALLVGTRLLSSTHCHVSDAPHR